MSFIELKPFFQTPSTTALGLLFESVVSEYIDYHGSTLKNRHLGINVSVSLKIDHEVDAVIFFLIVATQLDDFFSIMDSSLSLSLPQFLAL